MKKLEESMRVLITIIIALMIGVLAITLTSKEPGIAIKYFFTGPFSSAYFFGNMLAASIPLMLTGLATSIAFSASAFNLGLEGQVYFGALCGTYVAYELNAVPPIIAIIVVLAVSFAAGGGIAAISGYLKSKWNVDELISSLLVSYTLIYIVDFFLEGPFKDPAAGLAASPYFNKKFVLPKILLPSDLHIGIFIVLAIIILFSIIMKRNKFGYEVRITGKNFRFAKYAGIPVKKVVIMAMFFSGGIAGLAGMIDILGIHGRMIRGYSAGYGWNGIAVALIARNNPLLVIPAAIFFAFLQSGANVSALFSDVTPEVARIIQAAVFYLVTAEGLLFFLKKKRMEKGQT
ncbi:MAG: ABC transporter permease [Thermotoga sp.]|nr:MAG: ABC transporter permease [Thermotoga sp.]